MGIINPKVTVKHEIGTCALLAVSTFLFSLLIYAAFSSFSRGPEETNIYYGFGFGCATSFVFMLAFIVAGGLKNSYEIVVSRWMDFFESLQISFKFAISEFFENIKDDGMVFWLYILIMIIQVYVAYYCFSFLIDYFGIVI